jgi:hypothetical protein
MKKETWFTVVIESFAKVAAPRVPAAGRTVFIRVSRIKQETWFTVVIESFAKVTGT